MFSSILYVFFFSSRRRHTILQGDWSSDVCSSDLAMTPIVFRVFRRLQLVSSALVSLGHGTNDAQKTMGVIAALLFANGYLGRSEERRVGKECSSRWSPYN